MSVPSISDRIWFDIVEGRKKIEFNFLAAKMLMGRMLLLSPEQQKSQGEIKRFATLLHDLFEKNSHIPSVQDDLKKITG
jgi:hypothetical protein